MVVGNENKRERKKEKERRGFGRLPSFFFPPFLFVLLRCGDFGPNLVVFFVFWGFESLKFLIKCFLYWKNRQTSTNTPGTLDIRNNNIFFQTWCYSLCFLTAWVKMSMTDDFTLYSIHWHNYIAWNKCFVLFSMKSISSSNANITSRTLLSPVSRPVIFSY